MKILRYIIAAVVLLTAHNANAQFTLAIDRNALDSLPGTTYVLNAGGAINSPAIGIYVFNTSNAAITDSISFLYSIISGGVASPRYDARDYNGSGIEYHPHPTQIGAGDSAYLQDIIFHFTSPQFVVGSSVVVIWPTIYSGGVPLNVAMDSARIQVNIIDPTAGINEKSIDGIKAYMSGSKLLVKNSIENTFGEIRIYNTVGELILTKELSQEASIPMQQYATGMYTVEVALNDGRRGVYKVLNTN